VIRLLIGWAVLAVCVMVWAALAFSCLFLAGCNAGLEWLGNHVDDLGD
jgi:hypothetical protein